jgi:hypothetical protein
MMVMMMVVVMMTLGKRRTCNHHQQNRETNYFLHARNLARIPPLWHQRHSSRTIAGTASRDARTSVPKTAASVH